MAPKQKKEDIKGKAIAQPKTLTPHPLQVMPSPQNEAHKQWAQRVGFEGLIQQDWLSLADPQGAEELIKEFSETDTIIIEGYKPLSLSIDVVHKALGLPCEGDTETNRAFVVSDEIPKKGTMHQIKDVANEDRRNQFIFYLQNLSFMAKTEDMSAKNYNRLKAAEEGDAINWAAIYMENIRKRVNKDIENGGSTIVHAHLRALAQVAEPDDQQAPRAKIPSRRSSETQSSTQHLMRITLATPPTFSDMRDTVMIEEHKAVESPDIAVQRFTKKRKRMAEHPVPSSSFEGFVEGQPSTHSEQISGELPTPAGTGQGKTTGEITKLTLVGWNQPVDSKHEATLASESSRQALGQDDDCVAEPSMNPENLSLRDIEHRLTLGKSEANVVLHQVGSMRRALLQLDVAKSQLMECANTAESSMRTCLTTTLNPVRECLQRTEEARKIKKLELAVERAEEELAEKGRSLTTSEQARQELLQSNVQLLEANDLQKVEVCQLQDQVKSHQEKSQASAKKLQSQTRMMLQTEAKVEKLQKELAQITEERASELKKLTTMEEAQKVWQGLIEELRVTTATALTAAEALEAENKLLKMEEDQEVDVLMITPQAREEIQNAVVTSLKGTWDQALADMWKLHQEVVPITPPQIQSSTPLQEKERLLKEISYWKRQVDFFRLDLEDARKQLQEATPTEEATKLFQEAITENYQFRQQSQKLQAFTMMAGEFERQKTELVNELQNSVQMVEANMAQRRRTAEYPTPQDHIQEALRARFLLMLEQAKTINMDHPGNVLFCVQDKYALLQKDQEILQLQQELREVKQVAELVKASDQQQLSTGHQKLTRGELIKENRWLKDELQLLLKSSKLELYKTTTHVLLSEFARIEHPMPDFFVEAKEVLEEVWHNPLPPSHAYHGKLYARGPQQARRYPIHRALDIQRQLDDFQISYREEHPLAAVYEPEQYPMRQGLGTLTEPPRLEGQIHFQPSTILKPLEEVQGNPDMEKEGSGTQPDVPDVNRKVGDTQDGGGNDSQLRESGDGAEVKE